MATLLIDDQHKIEVPDDKLTDTKYVEARVDAERKYQSLMGVWEDAQGKLKAWESQREQLYPDPVERRRFDDDLAAQTNELRRRVNEADSLRRSMDEPLLHNALTAGSSVMRGAAGAASFMGDLLNVGGAQKDPNASIGATMMDNIASRGEFPVTKGGKQLASIVEAGAGGLASTPRNMGRNVAIGTAAGVGGEAVGALLNTDDPILKSLGGLGLAMPVGFAANLRKATPELARNVRNSATQDEWAAALKSMEQTQAEGMPSVINQHIPRANAVDDLVNVLAQRSSGKNVTDTLRMQPELIEDRARNNLLELGQDTGGAPRADVVTLASEDRRDWTKYRKSLTDERTKKAREAGQQALEARKGELVTQAKLAELELQDFDRRFTPELNDLQKEPNVIGGAAGAGPYQGKAPGSQERLDTLTAKRKELEERAIIARSLADDPERLPPQVSGLLADKAVARASSRSLENTDTAKALQMIGKALRNTKSVDGYVNLKNNFKGQLTKYKLNVPASDLREAGVIGGLFKDLDEALGIHGEGHRAAKQAYREFSETEVNPVTKGVVGKMTGKGSSLSGTDSGPSFLSLLRKGTVPGAKKSEIITAGRRLDPQTLYDNAATYYNELLNGSSGAITKVGARAADDTPARVSWMFSGAQGQGLRDVFAIVAEKMEGQGLLPRGQRPNFVRGAEVLKRHADITRIRPNRMQEMSGHELDDIAKADPTLLAAKQAGPLMQYSSPIKQAELFLSHKAYQTISENLTTPEGVRFLLEMGKVRPGSAQAEALIQGFLAGHRDPQQ